MRGVVWLLAVLAVLGLLGGAWWFFTQPARQAGEVAKVEAGQTIAHGQLAAGSDAGKIADTAHQTADVNEAQTRENTDAIQHAPGADQPVDPGLNRVALSRVCHRPSAARTAVCLQFAHPAQSAR